jgi:hypothetical protein
VVTHIFQACPVWIFSHILSPCLLFIAESRKYNPVVILLHNQKMAREDFNQVSSSFETVQCILSSILCPSIFREIWRHIAIALRFYAR